MRLPRSSRNVFHDAAAAASTRLRPRGLERLQPDRRLGHGTEERQRKHQPPDADAHEREPHRGGRVRQAERRGAENPGQVDQQQDAATDEPHREARGRDPVDVARRGDVGQQRVVEDQRGGDPDVGGHEEAEGVDPLATADRGHEQRRGHAEEHEDQEQAFLQGAMIGERAEHRGHQRDDRERDRRPPGKARGGIDSREPRGGVAGEERRKDGGDDRGPEGRIGPVVHRPGAQFGRAESESCEQSCHRRCRYRIRTSCAPPTRGAANRRRRSAGLP